MDRILDGSLFHVRRDHAYKYARVNRHEDKVYTSPGSILHVGPPYDAVV